MGLGAMLERLLRGAPPPTIATRLSATDAIAIAREAAVEYPLHDNLNVATATRAVDGAVIWRVETGGVGSFLYVLIDDATGIVRETHSYDGR